MPLFDYRCYKCGLIAEYLVKTGEGVRCKACDHYLGVQDRMPSMPASRFPGANEWHEPNAADPRRKWKRQIADIRRKG